MGESFSRRAAVRLNRASGMLLAGHSQAIRVAPALSPGRGNRQRARLPVSKCFPR